jgi:Icc-related predicted phosphoesterase
VCDIERILREKKPKLVLHGHTHSSCDYTIDHDDGTATRVVCNPFGYPHEPPNTNFNPSLVIDVDELAR